MKTSSWVWSDGIQLNQSFQRKNKVFVVFPFGLFLTFKGWGDDTKYQITVCPKEIK